MIVSILGVEKVFNDVLNSKQTILHEKNGKEKWILSKVVNTLVFVKKNGNLELFFSLKTSLKKVFW